MIHAALLCLSLVQPVTATTPLRFVAPRDGLLHASLYRSFADTPATLEIEDWPGEVRSLTPENTQTYPGRWSFRAGRVEKGRTYLIRASEPGELDLEVLDAPDGVSSGRAVASGLSWLVRAADAWLSNQPRQGAANHPEARACVACHVTQFTTRAYLTAALNGHAAPAQMALTGVMTRLRENPRPLYGHDGVNWSRVIHSARTVSSRLPLLFDAYSQATGAPAERDLILGAARYLRLADDCGRGELRAEADGARPEVSGFEIGLQTWQTFTLAARLEPAEPSWPERAACVADLLTRTKPKNTIDAAWRLIALKRLGRPTEAAARELIALQQPDGRFGLALDAKAAPADFISYHVLYALAVAGERGPAVERLRGYALRQQRADGSWKGAPEYKGFDTPFRETQFAVMALSELDRRPFTAKLPLLSRSISPAPDPWRRADRAAWQEKLVVRLEKEQTPELIDALAASLDENLAMLLEWQRALRRESDQQQVETALRADHRRVAALLARALHTPARRAVLAALAKVPGVEGFAARPRVGNDLEAPRLVADADGALERALIECLRSDDRATAAAAIRASTALADVLSPSFAEALLSRLAEFTPEIAAAYGPEGRAELALSRGGLPPAGLAALLAQVLKRRSPAELAVVLPMVARLDTTDTLVHDRELEGAVEALLRTPPTAAVLEAAAVFPRVADGPLMRTQVLAALEASDVALVRSAVAVVVERFVVNPNVAAMTGQFLKHARGLSRRMLLDALDTTGVRFRNDLVSAYAPPRFEIPADASILGLEFVEEFVLTSLRSDDALVRRAAGDLARKQERLHRSAAVRAALPAPLASEPELDYEFFRTRVQPIFETASRADGRSCAMCHAANARFPLRADPRANFAAAVRKVNTQDPLASALLAKPLLPAVSADGDLANSAHNGGERWASRTGSVEYQTILEWIRRAK